MKKGNTIFKREMIKGLIVYGKKYIQRNESN